MSTYTAAEFLRYYHDCVAIVDGKAGIFSTNPASGEITFVPVQPVLEHTPVCKDPIKLGNKNDWQEFVEQNIKLPRIHNYIFDEKNSRGVFVSRMGIRQTEKGVNRKAMTYVDPVGAFKGGMPYHHFCVASLCHHGQELPSLGKAYYMVSKAGALCVPFSKDWAVYLYERRIVLGYRGHFVGQFIRKRPELADGAEHLMESLLRATGEML